MLCEESLKDRVLITLPRCQPLLISLLYMHCSIFISADIYRCIGMLIIHHHKWKLLHIRCNTATPIPIHRNQRNITCFITGCLQTIQMLKECCFTCFLNIHPSFDKADHRKTQASPHHIFPIPGSCRTSNKTVTIESGTYHG